jgi:fructoselysine-6-P-deglycase FrlB-like protein
MSDLVTALIDQVAFLPAMIRAEVMPIEAKLRTLIATPDIYRIRHIILTGSGDSLIAGQAAATALRAWTGLSVQPMPAMEAARYVDMAPMHANPRSVLAVCISSSGEGARVVEAAQRLRSMGALTVAITADPASRLALMRPPCSPPGCSASASPRSACA